MGQHFFEAFLGPSSPEATQGCPALRSLKQIGARFRFNIFLGPSSPQVTQGYPAVTSLKISWRGAISHFKTFWPQRSWNYSWLSSPHFTKEMVQNVLFKIFLGPSSLQVTQGYPVFPGAIFNFNIFGRKRAWNYSGLSGLHFTKNLLAPYPIWTFFGPSGPQVTQGYPAVTSQKEMGQHFFWNIFGSQWSRSNSGLSSPPFTKTNWRKISFQHIFGPK